MIDWYDGCVAGVCLCRRVYAKVGMLLTIVGWLTVDGVSGSWADEKGSSGSDD